jgi:hypothetical protein
MSISKPRVAKITKLRDGYVPVKLDMNRQSREEQSHTLLGQHVELSKVF